MTFSDPKFKKYFDELEYYDVIKTIRFLKERLPVKCTRNNYQLTKKHLGINQKVKEAELQDYLQMVADKFRDHLLIAQPIKILVMSNVEAGKFEQINNLNCIYINDSLKSQTIDQKLAILAHEMTHYYLISIHGISFPKVEDNEFLTEICAVYIGFGLILRDGYYTVEEREGELVKKTKVGYITPGFVKEAIIYTAYNRKQNPLWIVKNVDVLVKPIYYVRLYKLIREYKKARKKSVVSS